MGYSSSLFPHTLLVPEPASLATDQPVMLASGMAILDVGLQDMSSQSTLEAELVAAAMSVKEAVLLC